MEPACSCNKLTCKSCFPTLRTVSGHCESPGQVHKVTNCHMTKCRETGTCGLRKVEEHAPIDGGTLANLAKSLGAKSIEIIERDPSGKAPQDAGSKLDAGKVRMGLVLGGFSRALTEVAKVGTFGARKYTDNGWMTVEHGVARYTDAMLRHHMQETIETHDPDSGLLHAAHEAWNALARLDLMLREKEATS